MLQEVESMLQEVVSVLGAGRRRGAGTSEGAKFWATAEWRWKAPVPTGETMRRGLCAYTLLMEGGRQTETPAFRRGDLPEVDREPPVWL